MRLIMSSPGLCVTMVAKADCLTIGDETGFTLKCFLSQIDGFYFVRETREAKGYLLRL